MIGFVSGVSAANCQQQQTTHVHTYIRTHVQHHPSAYSHNSRNSNKTVHRLKNKDYQNNTQKCTTRNHIIHKTVKSYEKTLQGRIDCFYDCEDLKLIKEFQ